MTTGTSPQAAGPGPRTTTTAPPSQALGDRRPQLVLGAMYFGTRVDPTRSHDLLDAFVGSGGTWVDTADCYAFWADPSQVGGQSERVIGDWLAARPGMRSTVRLSTKARYQPLVPGRWPESAEGLSPQAVRDAARGSLQRLGQDHVDLFWAHGEDRDVDLLDTVRAMAELVADGWTTALGASNHAAWRVERARRLAADHGLPAWQAVQLRHSYLRPRPGAPLPDAGGHVLLGEESADLAVMEDLAVWGYTPLLNGAYTRSDRAFPEPYEHPGTSRRLAALQAVADECGATANQVVLAWMLASTPPVWPIIGVSTTQQLEEAMAARDLVLTDTQKDRLDAAS